MSNAFIRFSFHLVFIYSRFGITQCLTQEAWPINTVDHSLHECWVQPLHDCTEEKVKRNKFIMNYAWLGYRYLLKNVLCMCKEVFFLQDMACI